MGGAARMRPGRTVGFRSPSDDRPDMDAISFDDRLDVLGVLAGVFIVLGALGSLLGAPWATNPDTLAVLALLLGVVLTIAVGAGLIWIVQLE